MNLQLPGKQQQAWFGEAGSGNLAEGLWMEREKTKLLWSTLGECGVALDGAKGTGALLKSV
jgi:hypothetical protein